MNPKLDINPKLDKHTILDINPIVITNNSLESVTETSYKL